VIAHLLSVIVTHLGIESLTVNVVWMLFQNAFVEPIRFAGLMTGLVQPGQIICSRHRDRPIIIIIVFALML